MSPCIQQAPKGELFPVKVKIRNLAFIWQLNGYLFLVGHLISNF